MRPCKLCFKKSTRIPDDSIVKVLSLRRASSLRWVESHWLFRSRHRSNVQVERNVATTCWIPDDSSRLCEEQQCYSTKVVRALHFHFSTKCSITFQLLLCTVSRDALHSFARFDKMSFAIALQRRQPYGCGHKGQTIASKASISTAYALCSFE